MASKTTTAELLLSCDDCHGEPIPYTELVSFDGASLHPGCAWKAAAEAVEPLLSPNFTPAPGGLRSAEEAVRVIRQLLAVAEARVKVERTKTPSAAVNLADVARSVLFVGGEVAMARAITVKVGWTGDDGEEFAVRCRVTPGTPRPASFGPGSRWVPGDDEATVDVLSVRSEAGVEREDLIDLVQDDREFRARAEEEAADRDAAARAYAEEARAEAIREDRRLGL